MGDGLNEVLPRDFGIAIGGYEQFTAEVKDMTSYLQKLRDAGCDIIAFDSVARDGLRIVMTGMQNLAWKAPVVCGPTAIIGNLEEQVPSAVRDQFYGVVFRVSVRTQEPPSQAMTDFVARLKAHGPIDNLAVSAMNHDVVFLAKWAFETAQREFGNTSGDSLKAVVESIRERDYPADYSLFAGKPSYTSDDHTMATADHSKMYGLIRVGYLVDGAYQGEALDLG